MSELCVVFTNSHKNPQTNCTVLSFKNYFVYKVYIMFAYFVVLKYFFRKNNAKNVTVSDKQVGSQSSAYIQTFETTSLK